MEFAFDLSKLLPAGDDGIAILNGKDYSFKPSIYPSYSTQKQSNSTPETQLVQILDKMGTASSKAQGLKSIITDYSKFVTSDHRLYLKIESNAVLGLLKVGAKNLFYHDAIGNVKELRPLCLLDFYVHESVQRMGVGKELFEKMLEVEKSEPHLIAYDRPSSKLIAFLQKYYGLVDYIPQNNNFVIFNDYFYKKGSEGAYYDPKSGRKDRSFQMGIQGTNSQSGSVLKKPTPIGSQSNTQSEFYKGESYPSGKGVSKFEGQKFNENIEQDSQYQQLKQMYGINKQRPQLQSNDPIYHGYNSGFTDPAKQNYGKSLQENTEGGPQKMTRGERNMIDIQEKLKRTEEDIEKCKQKIEELSVSKTSGIETKTATVEAKGQEEDTAGRGKFKQRVQELNNKSAPWATHHTIVSQTSSSAYGSYLTKK